ncbi:MAG: FG-GAP repeat domain-containing protein [Planctomycetota bacterium]
MSMQSLRAALSLFGSLLLGLLASPNAVRAQPVGVELSVYEVLIPWPQPVTVIQTGDLDSDGFLDIVFSTSNAIHWAASDGQGGYLAPQQFASLSGVQYMTVSDLDADSDLDVVLLQGDGSVYRIDNNLPAAFAAPAFVGGSTSWGDLYGLVVGDLTGNGLADVVVLHENVALRFDQMSVGSFGPSQVYQGVQARGAAVGDLGGSTIADIVFTGTDGNALVFLDGSLNTPVVSVVGGDERPFLYYRDNDACLDLVVTGGNDSLWSFRGDCAGGFRSPFEFPLPNGRPLVARADFDGFFDVLVTPFFNPLLQFHRLQVHRRGEFGFTGQVFEYLVPCAPQLIVDLDGDGLDELLFTLGGVMVARPRSTGEYRAPELVESRRTSECLFVDLDGDGNGDLISGGEGSDPENPSLIRIRAGLGDGQFEEGVPYNAGTGGTTDLAVIDLNQDGRLDVVVGRYGFETLYRHQLPNGYLGPANFVPVCSAPTQLLTSDVTGDGHEDLLIGCTGSNEVRVMSMDGVSTSLIAVVQSLAGFSAADLDGDGLQDLVVADKADGAMGQVRVFRSVGGGQFQPLPSVTQIPGELSAVALADMNGDGFEDLIVGARLGGVRWFLGSGTGLFGPTSGTVLTEPLTRLVAGDLNGDGLADVVVGAHLQILLSTGATLAPPIAHPIYVSRLRLSDVDADGRLDIVCATGLGAAVLRNETFDPPSDRRGDCNDDGMFGLPDAVAELQLLFQSGAVACEDACDVDDSGTLNLLDPLLLLQYLFQGGEPPAGLSGCRPDATTDNLAPCPGSTGCPAL